MAFSAVDAIGVVGLVVLLSAFVANAFGKLTATSVWYQLGNFVGSGILAVYAYLIESWVFLPLEIVWAAVALWALARRARTRPSAAI